ncbi:MAG: DNA gyrase inhibitor YacG [Hyphomicrobiaceae bacterium]
MQLKADNDDTHPRIPKCANCNKPMAPDFRPFCSQRCKDVDLSRWLSGRYAIPGGNSDADEDGDDAAAATQASTHGDDAG